MRQLSQSLAANLAVLDKMFGTSADYYAKEITIYHCRGSILLFDGMASLDSLWELLLDAASRQAPPQQAGQRCTGPQVFELILHGSAFPAESEPVTDLADLIKRMTAGMAVLLLDGCAKGIAFSVQGLKFRSVDEPSGEGNLRGSREGFVETYQTNISLLRRRLKTTELKFEKVTVGEESQTPAALCYLKNIADPKIINTLKKRLSACNLKDVLAAGYLAGYLEHPAIFDRIGFTERPDTLCGKLHEGRIGLLIDGTPTALYVPYLFVENFQTADDYANRPFYATFTRWLKYIAFFLAIFLPGLYVGIAAHDPELLPETLLVTIAQAERSTPFPVMLEAILLYFMYELMREAGLRVPKPLGSSVGIVGGLVIGETAVSAGLVSAPSLVVIAVTVITGYTVPKLYEPMAVLRLTFILVGGIWGVWGVLAGFTFLLFELCGKTSFSVPFLAPVSPPETGASKAWSPRAEASP